MEIKPGMRIEDAISGLASNMNVANKISIEVVLPTLIKFIYFIYISAILHIVSLAFITYILWR